MYIYSLILGLLLADVAIKLHKSSECEVPIRRKDFVDTATTTSGARTVAFTGVYLLDSLSAKSVLAGEKLVATYSIST